jgi:hypothetical protein
MGPFIAIHCHGGKLKSLCNHQAASQPISLPPPGNFRNSLTLLPTSGDDQFAMLFTELLRITIK